jgi:hypothetical protein
LEQARKQEYRWQAILVFNCSIGSSNLRSPKMKRLPLFAGVLLALAGFLPSFCFSQSEVSLASNNAGFTVPAAARLPQNAVSDATVVANGDQPGAPSGPEPSALPAQASTSEGPRVGIGVRFSTLGLGGEVAVRLANRVNVRAGGSALSISHSVKINGIEYAGQARFRSAEAHLDFFLVGSFHVSPGLLIYNGNNANVNISIPGAQSFTIGGTTYESGDATSANGPIAGNLTVKFKRVAPEILIGTGNLVPRGLRRHWSINSDFGFDYEGSPQIGFGLAGSACLPPSSTGLACANAATDPIVQANIKAQQAKYNHNASAKFYYSLWPVFSTGFSYSF